MKQFLMISIFIILFHPSLVYADDMVTVKLIQYTGNSNEMTIQLHGDYHTLSPILTLEKGKKYDVKVKDGKLLLKGDGSKNKINGPIIVIPNQYDKNHWICLNDRSYLGAMAFEIENGQYIRPINQLPLEDYLKGVVPFEVYPSWGLEALKAQSLAARTYAVKRKNQVMDDTVSFQAYGGYDWNSSCTKAIKETEGEVITYHHELIDALYSASNGGYTESNSHVWDREAKPYFPIKSDPYDPIEPWELSFHEIQIDLNNIDWNADNWWNETTEKDKGITDSMKSWLHRNGYPGEIRIIAIPAFTIDKKRLSSKRSVTGSITIEFLQRLMEGTVMYKQVNLEHVKLNQIRPIFGGSIFRSYFIDSLMKQDNLYSLTGRGFGHGVGMSQHGANSMSEHGKSYQEIIQYYYPGTKIKQTEKNQH